VVIGARRAAGVGATALVASACNALIGNEPPILADAGDAEQPTPDAPSTADVMVPSGCTDAQASCAGGCTDLDRDPANCGWCGHSCGGRGCSARLCEPEAVIAPGAPLRGITDFVVAPGAVYVSGQGPYGDVARAALPPAGGPLTWLVPPAGFWYSTTLALDASTLFYGMVDSSAMEVDVVFADGSGGSRHVVRDNGTVDQIGVDPDYVYYSLRDTPAGLYRVARDPGDAGGGADGGVTPRQLVSSRVYGFVVTPAAIYALTNDAVFTVLKDGSAMTWLAPAKSSIGIAADAAYVYYADMSTRQIFRKARSSGAVQEELTPPFAAPLGVLAIDAASIYTGAEGVVSGVDKDGSHLRTYARWAPADSLDIVKTVGVDDGYVYWDRYTSSQPSLWRVPK
jgi:hypothetical protein